MIASPADKRQIQEYEILTSNCEGALSREIDRLLANGAYLYGFPFYSHGAFHQAVIYYKEEV